MRLAGKVAIVTGAGGGFGEGIARRFAAEGAKVAVVDLREDAAAAVAASIGPAAIALTADVGVEADVNRVVADTIAHLGTPDVNRHPMLTPDWSAPLAVDSFKLLF